jgi:peptidoglycan/LPS O-acetylase OafA/YrhL
MVHSSNSSRCNYRESNGGTGWSERLATIRDFLHDVFAIDGNITPTDDWIKSLDGRFYKSLDSSTRRRIDQYSLRCFRITDYMPDEPSELFYRLNQPTMLTAGEQRNALYGPAREQLKTLVLDFEAFGNDKKTIGFSNARLAYDDIIARVLFFLENGNFGIKGTEALISERFRSRVGFPDEVINRTRHSIELFSARPARTVGKNYRHGRAADRPWVLHTGRPPGLWLECGAFWGGGFMQGHKFGFADALRGPAALCVVLSHFIPDVRPDWQLPMQLLGQLGVAVFFLVSGLVIPISLTKYGTGAFLVARVLRIYPTYAVALTITLMSIWMVGEQPLGNDVTRYISNYLIADMFFNQPAFDNVVWTLQVELHFYLLCALLAPLIRSFRLEILALPFVIFFFEAAALQSSCPLAVRLTGEAPFLLFMFGGVGAFYFVNRKISAAATLLYCAGCSCLLALAWWYGILRPNAYLSPAYAIGAAIFVVALFYGTGMRGGFFSRISYPLYVIHTGIGVLALKWMLWHSFSSSSAVLLGLAVAVGTATIVHFVVEAPTHRIGQRLAASLIRLSAASLFPAAAGWRPQRAESGPSTGGAKSVPRNGDRVVM